MTFNSEFTDHGLDEGTVKSLKDEINIIDEQTEESCLLASKSSRAANSNKREVDFDHMNYLPSAASSLDPTPKNVNYGSALAPYFDMYGSNLTPKRNLSSASMDIAQCGYDTDNTGYSKLQKIRSCFNIRWTGLMISTCLVFLATGVAFQNLMSQDVLDIYAEYYHKHHFHDGSHPEPFSFSHPSRDLKVPSIVRGYATQLHINPNGEEADLGDVSSNKKEFFSNRAIPTNSWYQNLLLFPPGQVEPSLEQRAYTMPYIVDMVGPVPGLRVHQSNRIGWNLGVQLSVSDTQGLTLGLSTPLGTKEVSQLSKIYGLDNNNGSPFTPLSLNINWKGGINNDDDKINTVTKMESSLVKGMPYITMKYIFANGEHKSPKADSHETVVLPTIVTEMSLLDRPVIDESKKMICSEDPIKSSIFEVQREVEVSFRSSDSAWMIFFSQPVNVRCVNAKDKFQLQVVDLIQNTSTFLTEDRSEQLFIRVALANNCVSGSNRNTCKNGKPNDTDSVVAFKSLLRQHADVIPGKNVQIKYSFKSNDHDLIPSTALLEFDWDQQLIRSDNQNSEENSTNVLMFALSHHFEQMNLDQKRSASFCVQSLLGDLCPIEGSKWTLLEELDHLSFRAPRAPTHESIPDLVKALNEDIKFRLPEYFQKGVGDTYFSGKMLAKLGRILLIAEELNELQQSQSSKDTDIQVSRVRKNQVNNEVDEKTLKTMEALRDLVLPNDASFRAALDHLRSSVEIWINGNAEAPFVYDEVWGGLVNCGCLFNDKTWSCNNKFPNCPALSDAGMNFGNGFYNDHHFHYGYHIYAAAVVAHFDGDWGKKNFENVLLLIRDIANPSELDTSFTTFRHKDWYIGSSWASGIVIPPLLNGRNQESSSEAIAAYEAVGLYGDVMARIWAKERKMDKLQASLHVREIGRLLTSTELRAADRYWHVRKNDPSRRIYPEVYGEPVMGMIWSTMAQFQTFFGSAPYLVYGIQLLPLTPIAEKRDDYTWIQTLYPKFVESCESNSDCKEQGWSVLGYSILATIGHKKLALKMALSTPPEAFEAAGGNGHSMTNTLWYIATRPENPAVALPTEHKKSQSHGDKVAEQPGTAFSGTCHCAESCTSDILSTLAGQFSCGDRIKYLMGLGRSESNACIQIATKEFPDECGHCNPRLCADYVEPKEECPPCSSSVCQSDANRCPIQIAPFLCTGGINVYGCSFMPWDLESGQCTHCCEITDKCLEN